MLHNVERGPLNYEHFIGLNRFCDMEANTAGIYLSLNRANDQR
jgi:hypothetical protein